MDAPNTNWHPVFLNKNKINDIEQDFEEYQDSMLEYMCARYSDGISEHETLESIALNIGMHAQTCHSEYVQPQTNGEDGTAKRVILSYIGAYAMKKSN